MGKPYSDRIDYYQEYYQKNKTKPNYTHDSDEGREKRRQYMREYRKRNPKYVQKTYERKRVHYKQKRESVITALGGKCIQCGLEDIRVLQFDHIDPLNNHKRSWDEVEKAIEQGNIQLLCANCHAIKSWHS